VTLAGADQGPVRGRSVHPGTEASEGGTTILKRGAVQLREILELLVTGLLLAIDYWLLACSSPYLW